MSDETTPPNTSPLDARLATPSQLSSLPPSRISSVLALGQLLGINVFIGALIWTGRLGSSPPYILAGVLAMVTTTLPMPSLVSVVKEVVRKLPGGGVR